MTFAFPATRLSLRIPTGPGTTISCYASAIRPVFAVSHRTGIRSCCATCGYILPLSERLHCFPSVGSPVPLSESVGFLIGVLMAEHNGISFRIPIVCSRKRTLLQWVAPNATASASAGAISTQSLRGSYVTVSPIECFGCFASRIASTRRLASTHRHSLTVIVVFYPHTALRRQAGQLLLDVSGYYFAGGCPL